MRRTRIRKKSEYKGGGRVRRSRSNVREKCEGEI